jgi:hypothetical protein
MNSPPLSPITPLYLLATMPIHITKPYLIKAKQSYFPTTQSELYFCKDQEFYALVEDNREYLVSTSKTCPFARNHINGFVPKSLFEKVEINPQNTEAPVFKVLRSRTVYCK